MKKVVALFAVMVMAALAGCSQGSKTGGVAVLDLDRVGNAVGWMEEINKSLQATDTELQNQVKQVVEGAQKSINDAKGSLANDAKLTADQKKVLMDSRTLAELEPLPLTKEQRDKLMQTVAQANLVLQQAQQSYQQQMQQRRAALIVSYREKVRPIARRIAAKQGLSVVVVPSDALLYSDPTVDITDKVIDELRAK